MLINATLILVALLALSVPVAGALGMLALSMSGLYSIMPLSLALGEVAWANSVEFVLVAVPMFILLGEVLLRAGIADKMYNAMVQWLSWLPGGLMHANVGACAMFAATSGSSVATAATVGTVAIPQIEKRGYNAPLFLGTIAAGGTLGILIPPSINIIIYGMLTNTSVPQLYLAGFIPGFGLAILFSILVVTACLIRPHWGGHKVETSWRSRAAVIPDLGPPLLIFLVVVGSIYAGLATPTEAASVGVVAAFLLAAWNRRFNWTMIQEVAQGTMQSTAMVMAIIVAAIFLNFILAAVGLTQALAAFIEQLGWTPFQMMIAIIVFYAILGCFMETLSMMITTTPLIAPIVFQLGYDPVWYGIVLTILMELALITPPVGLNLYIVQGVRRTGSLTEVIQGALPFVLSMFTLIALLIAFPDIALWLPRQFYAGN
ncbi:MAG: TRAP transporter large permease [Alphaproteobacteria bacterium]|nr:TRAP transporter large permease [Alphaproteobacteria bacterium]